MADRTVVAFISTPEIPLVGDIQLENPGTYRVVSISPGGLTWVRNEVGSPYVHGSTLIGAIKENPQVELVIRVYGSSANDLHVKLGDLLRAFEQFRYRLGITIDGQAYEWYCQPADYAPVDGEWDKFALSAFQQAYRFIVPREPTPIAGAH